MKTSKSELDRNFQMWRERNLKLKMILTKSTILNYNLMIQDERLYANSPYSFDKIVHTEMSLEAIRSKRFKDGGV